MQVILEVGPEASWLIKWLIAFLTFRLIMQVGLKTQELHKQD